MPIRLVLLALLILYAIPCLCQAPSPARPDEQVLGPARDVALVSDFPADAQAAWQPRGGRNLTWTVQAGYRIPAVANTLLRIDLQRTNESDKEPGNNWFGVDCKDLPPGRVPADVDGLRFSIGSHNSSQWWVHVELTLASGEKYGNVIADHPFPPGRMVDYLVPLERFKSKSGESLTPAGATTLRAIGFVLGGAHVQPRTFYIDQISAYRIARYDSWVTFTTSHPSNNLFYRDEPVSISFTPSTKRPAGALKLRYEIRDDTEALVYSDTLDLTDSSTVTSKLDLANDGYYQVTAFFADAAGKPLSDHSCIRPEGTQPDGIGTFSILPRTQQETIDHRRTVGQDAFFGLHGDFLNLADHLGASWRLEYSHWRYLEAQKPDRSQGEPKWVASRLAEPPRPAWQYNFQPFVFNIRSGLPEWAVSTGDTPPAFNNWDDALAVVRDYARVSKHLYPHQSPRIFGGAWEVNLNMQPYISQQPEYKAADVVELYRRVREVVKAEDPDALIAGPNPSTLNPEWYEKLFQAGVLQYLDAIETHAYDEGVFTPEENNTADRIVGLNELVRKYNNGKTLPIYCTERGNFGVLGSHNILREQAEIMTRSAIIMKGEGVRVFHPFYGIDYDYAQGFGFCFNLEMEGPGRPWGTQRISPKPMVNAMATCIRLLEGARPKERLRGLGENVWAYTFTTASHQINAIWTTAAAQTVSLPTANSTPAQLVTMMGRAQPAIPVNNRLNIPVTSAPVYLIQPLSDR